jgi:hypothetical protein
LIDELIRMKLFVIEMRDFVATLVPAEMASTAPEPSKSEARVTISGKVSADLAAQFREAASRSGTNVSAVLARLRDDLGAAVARSLNCKFYFCTNSSRSNRRANCDSLHEFGAVYGTNVVV